MKVFLSAISNEIDYFLANGISMKWNLISYRQLHQMSAKSRMDFFYKIAQNSEELLIDSGAHSFQFGKKVNWIEYTDSYCAFIREVDSPKVIGYFEMDIDNILGYDKVLALRKKIESVTDKVIPVWHNTRGVSDYKRMCREYSGRIVSVTGFANAEFRDEQYPMFLNEAWKNECRIHCLGMTRLAVLDKVPFDYVDSSTWKMRCIYGKVYNPRVGKMQKVNKKATKTQRLEGLRLNYMGGKAMQEHYYQYWRQFNGHYEWRR